MSDMLASCLNKIQHLDENRWPQADSGESSGGECDSSTTAASCASAEDLQVKPKKVYLAPGSAPGSHPFGFPRGAAAPHAYTAHSAVITPPAMRAQEPPAGALGGQPSLSLDEPQPPGHSSLLEGSLVKAMLDLNNTLPPQAALETQRLLSSVAVAQATGGPVGGGMDPEAVKWLMEHLIKQQEASLQKVMQHMSAGQPAQQSMPLDYGRVPAPLPAGGQAGAPEPGLGFAVPPAVHSWHDHPWAPFLPPGLEDAAAMNCLKARKRDEKKGAAVGAPVGAPMAGPRRQVKSLSECTQAGGPARAQQQQVHAETLRIHLRELLQVDSGCVLIVRKINRLGFASASALEQHYSWYGRVERVLVAHSRVKLSGAAAAAASSGGVKSSRLRPSGLGFMVMSRPEEARAILAEGPEQLVLGVCVRVQPFERRSVDDCGCEDEALY